MEESKYSLNLPLGKKDQYDKSGQITVRADHLEEFKNAIVGLWGPGAFDAVLKSVWDAFRATVTDVTPTPAASGAAPYPVPVSDAVSAPVTAAPTAAQYPSDNPVANDRPAAPQARRQFPDNPSQGLCPQCGTGDLVNKFRKGTGQFMGVGCNNYPKCDYMKYWARD